MRPGTIRLTTTLGLVAAALAVVPACSGAIPAQRGDGHEGGTWTVRLGHGAGPWTIGQRLVVRPGLVATERFPQNDRAVGCTGWSRIDYYRGVRVAWQFAPNAAHSALVDVATTTPGDRSSDGFVVGKTRLQSIRARYPQRPQRPRYDGSLGLTLLVVEKQTGAEKGVWLKFWFDSANVLTAIETGVSGC